MIEAMPEKTLPKITIITPSYNQGKYINQTIRSVLDQGYPNLEYIVVDGASTDGTIDILRKYDHKLIWISEPDRGQSHAINKGLLQATGDIFGYLNSDDLLLPGSLEKVGRYFATHPNAYWLTGRCRTVNENGKEIRKAITAYKNFWLRFASFRVLTILNYISQPATFWRKEVIQTIGVFDEKWHYVLDYDYWLRIGRFYKLWALEAQIAEFRLHAMSKSGSTAHLQFAEELLAIKKNTAPTANIHLHAWHNKLITAIYRLQLMNN